MKLLVADKELGIQSKKYLNNITASDKFVFLISRHEELIMFDDVAVRKDTFVILV